MLKEALIALCFYQLVVGDDLHAPPGFLLTLIAVHSRYKPVVCSSFKTFAQVLLIGFEKLLLLLIIIITTFERKPYFLQISVAKVLLHASHRKYKHMKIPVVHKVLQVICFHRAGKQCSSAELKSLLVAVSY